MVNKMKDNFFGGMSPEYFLKNHWNKKPCLFKKAIKNTKDILLLEDFFEMASDPDFESRLVYESGGDYPWQAKRGPFKKSDFKKNALWTLICHNLENYCEELYEIKKRVNFISDWHFDDVMATISKKGASVGAHIDDYSVFIFQGAGIRKWMIEEKPNDEFVPDIDIKLIKEFNPDYEWILEPGDMIYIPPGVAHHGVTIEDSISYSIGFKSIRYNQLLETMLSDDQFKLDEFSFHDKKIEKVNDIFNIPDHVILDLQKDLIKVFQDKEVIRDLLLAHLSKTRNQIIPNVEEDIRIKDVIKVLKANKIRRDVWAKFVSAKVDSKTYKIMINNKTYRFSKTEYESLKVLFESSPYQDLKIKSDLFKSKNTERFLAEMFVDGVFYIAE